MMEETWKEAELLEWLRSVEDPEMFLSIVDLGLIYGVEIDSDSKAWVEMTLTSPGCPAAQELVDQVKARMLEYPGVLDAHVDLVWEPAWDPSIHSSEAVKEKLGIW